MLYYLADGHIVAVVVVPENTEVKKMEKFLFKFIAFCDCLIHAINKSSFSLPLSLYLSISLPPSLSLMEFRKQNQSVMWICVLTKVDADELVDRSVE